MPNISKPHSKPISLDKNLPLDVQVRELERYLILLWNDRNQMNKDIEVLVNAVDPEYPTDRIINLIKSRYGHTAEMPDKAGSNKDHDNRYYSKDESESMFRRRIPLLTRDGRRLYDSKKRTITMDTHAS